MRVAIDGRYLSGQGSGIGTYTANMARALLEQDPQLEMLLILSLGGESDLKSHPRVETVTFPFPPNSVATRLLLGPFLRRHDFSLLHVPFAVTPLNLRRPLVVTVHDLMWLVDPRFNSNSRVVRAVAGRFYRASLEAAMSRAQRILTVSRASRQAITDHSPAYGAKTRVSYNGIDATRIYPLPEGEAHARLREIVNPGAPFVLTVGDASPHKNHYNAVRGFMEAFGRQPGWRMVLVRRFLRRDRRMRALMSRRSVRRKVITLGHVPNSVLNALNNAARISLQPSFYEGFGIPLLEAMATSTPIVTSRTSCLPEVAGSAALLVDPADPLEIAAALRWLDTDQALREALIAEGHKRLEIFTWEACARATLETYGEVVQGS